MSARARQLNHKIKNRKNAIVSRREAEAATSDGHLAHSPMSAGNVRAPSNGEQRSSHSPPSGFVAVNQQTPNPDSSVEHGNSESAGSGKPINGAVMRGASTATKAELLSKFFTNSERAVRDHDQTKASIISRPTAGPKAKLKHGSDSNIDAANFLLSTGTPVPIPNTPSSLLPYSKSNQQDRFDDSGPFKSDIMARMEQLNRGDRVQPPCDRCRRLHMDCLKNLTACMGCTKKHAKCSWKDVTEQELQDNPLVLRSVREDAFHTSSGPGRDRSRDPYGDLPVVNHSKPAKRDYAREEDRVVRDEELLGEDGSEDEEDMLDPQHQRPVGPCPPTAVMESHNTTYRPINDYSYSDSDRPSPTKNPEIASYSTAVTSASNDDERPPASTNGFQSVNVKGVVLGHDPVSQDEDMEDERKSEGDQSDKDREALIQLSAAAQQVSESQQQGQGDLEGEGAREEGVRGQEM